MEILNQFGFDGRLFLAQIINFLILVFLFKKFLYKPILKQIHDRETKIRRGLNDAELAQTALANAEAKQDEIIKKAGIESDKIIQSAKKTAEEIRETTLIKTRQESEKIIKEAKEQGALELEKVRSEANLIALSISKSILSKSLDGLFNEQEKKTIMERNIQNLKSLKQQS